MNAVRVLSFHAGYGCRHRGRCCSSGWPIAVDASERAKLESGLESGLLTAGRGTSAVFLRLTEPDGSALLASDQGHCVFHDDDAGGGCRIHRAMGHAALPLACRQFPRQSVRDPRGVSVTLSHYCPTAHDLLVQHSGPTTVVDNAPAFPPAGEYVGLTADSSLPPLLHPRLAMDWESWWLFEELSVSLISEASEPLARLGLAVEHARRWTVDSESLAAHLRDAFQLARSAAISDPRVSNSRTEERIADAIAAVPHDWHDAAMNAIALPSAGRGMSYADPNLVSRRYLAAHAFANWAAYQGEGLRTWFRAVETAAALLARTADPGRADLVLRHLADSSALIGRWNGAEREPAVTGSG